jgi:transposase-like protein
VLVELSVVEQRYRVVLEVLEDGLPVTEVAMRHGVSRPTSNGWSAKSVRAYRAPRGRSVQRPERRA